MAIDVKRVDVGFEAMGPGNCVWCGQAKDEVLTVSFSDRSFGGGFCFNDLKKALRMKLAIGNSRANGVPVASPPSSGVGTGK